MAVLGVLMEAAKKGNKKNNGTQTTTQPAAATKSTGSKRDGFLSSAAKKYTGGKSSYDDAVDKYISGEDSRVKPTVTTGDNGQKKTGGSSFFNQFATVKLDNVGKNATAGKAGETKPTTVTRKENIFSFDPTNAEIPRTYMQNKADGKRAGFLDLGWRYNAENAQSLNPITARDQMAWAEAYRNTGYYDDDPNAQIWQLSDTQRNKLKGTYTGKIGELNAQMAAGGTDSVNIPEGADAEGINTRLQKFLKDWREKGLVTTTDPSGKEIQYDPGTGLKEGGNQQGIAQDMYRYIYGEDAFLQEMDDNGGGLSEGSLKQMTSLLGKVTGMSEDEEKDLKFQRDTYQALADELDRYGNTYSDYENMMAGAEQWAQENGAEAGYRSDIDTWESGYTGGIQMRQSDKAAEIYSMFQPGTQTYNRISSLAYGNDDMMDEAASAYDHALFYLPKEIDKYQKYMNAGRPDLAIAFHEGLKKTLDYRYQQWKTGIHTRWSDTDPLGTGAATVVTQKLTGLEGLKNAAGRALGADDWDTYGANQVTGFTQTVRQNIAGNAGKDIRDLTGSELAGKFATNAVNSIFSGIDSGTDYFIGKNVANKLVALGAIKPAAWKTAAEIGSLGTMFGEVYQNSFYNTLQETGDGDYAMVTGVVDGIQEVLGETLFGADIALSQGASPMKYAGAMLAGEEIEELTGALREPVVNTIKDNLYEYATTGQMSGKTQWDKDAIELAKANPQQYAGEGGRQQAYTDALVNKGIEMAWTAVGTAISVGPKAIGAGGQQYGEYAQTGKAIIENDQVKDFAKIVIENGDAETRERGQAILDKAEQGKKISKAEIGALFQTISSQNNDKISQVAGRVLEQNIRGFLKDTYTGKDGEMRIDDRTLGNLAEIIRKGTMDGGSLSQSDRKMLEQYPAAMDLFNDMQAYDQGKQVDAMKRSGGMIGDYVKQQKQATQGLMDTARQLGEMAKSQAQKHIESIREEYAKFEKAKERAGDAVRTAADKMADGETVKNFVGRMWENAKARTAEARANWTLGEETGPKSEEEVKRKTVVFTDENGQETGGTLVGVETKVVDVEPEQKKGPRTDRPQNYVAQDADREGPAAETTAENTTTENAPEQKKGPRTDRPAGYVAQDADREGPATTAETAAENAPAAETAAEASPEAEQKAPSKKRLVRQYVVRTADGTEIRTDAVTAKAADAATAAAMTFIETSDMSDREATDLLDVVTGQDVKIGEMEALLKDARNVMTRGWLGMTFPAEIGYKPEAARALYEKGQAQKITDEETRTGGRRTTLNPGQGQVTYRGVDVKTLDGEVRKQVEAAAAIAKRVGYNIIFENDTKNTNRYGEYDAATGSVIINIAGKHQNGQAHHLMVAMSHEVTHMLERNSPEAYAQLREFVFKEMQRNGVDLVARIGQKVDNYNYQIRQMRQNGRNISDITIGGAAAEVVADACDQVFGNEQLITRLANENPTLFDKVKNAIADFIGKVKEAARGMRESGSFDSANIRDMDKLAEKWGIALEDVRNGGAANSQQNAGNAAESQQRQMSVAEIGKGMYNQNTEGEVNGNDEGNPERIRERARILSRADGWALRGPAAVSINRGDYSGIVTRGTEGYELFRKALNDSVIKSRRGDPIIWYHGSETTFNQFTVQKNKNYAGTGGFYFTNSSLVADYYARENKRNKNIYPAGIYSKANAEFKASEFEDNYKLQNNALRVIATAHKYAAKYGTDERFFKSLQQMLNREVNSNTISNEIAGKIIDSFASNGDIQSVIVRRATWDYDGQTEPNDQIIVFDSDNIIPATSAIWDQIADENRERTKKNNQLSLAEMDEQYMQAAESGDNDTAFRMAEEAAERNGYTIRAFHGTGRGDRVGNVFRPDRATSGPMAFFTDNRQIAENYARDKQDTSIAYDEEYGDYYHQFRGVSKKGKSVAIGDLWKDMTFRQRQQVTEAAKHITQDDDGNIIFDPSAKNGNGGFDSYRLREHQGNAINALVEVWLEDGTLYGEEGRFLDVLKLAGIDNATWNDPDARHERVYDTWLKIQKPFNTGEQYTQEFLDGLEAWWAKQDQAKYRRETNNSDFWDKNNWTLERWVERARDDVASGESHMWTSIPDFVTDYLKSMGYDGIQDVGGKNGGETHTVWIPFSGEQVKSAEAVTRDDNGKIIPLSERFNQEKNDIRFSLQETDNEYLAAARRGDTETAERLLDQAAQRAGFTDIGYHGSPSFGFTVFDMNASQDEIFVAFDQNIARTYTRHAFNTKAISEHRKTIYDMSDDELADLVMGMVITHEDENGNEIKESISLGRDGMYQLKTAPKRYGDQWEVSRTVTADEMREIAKPLFDKYAKEGIYKLYVRPGNQLEIDAMDSNWNEIPWSALEYATNDECNEWGVSDENKLKGLTTRQIAILAKDNDYDSVRIYNVYDHGGRSGRQDRDYGYGDIGIFFNQKDVKSADAITYDDNGEIIPPSERFNDDQTDIRFSLADINEMEEKRQDLIRTRDRVHEIETSKELQDAITKAMKEGDFDDYNEILSRTKLADLKRKVSRLEDEIQKWQKEYEEERNRKNLSREQQAIAKSGLTEPEYRNRQAVKQFGTTTNPNEAAYIIRNGSMLNFSGEKGQHTNHRGNDHRMIGIIYEDDNIQGSKAMYTFMNDGNIRIMPESPGIEVTSRTEPTAEQYRTLRRVINQIGGDGFSIDFCDENGHNIDSIMYDGRANGEKAIADIKHFYETGEVRQPSELSRFFSVAEEGMAASDWIMAMDPNDIDMGTKAEKALVRNYQKTRREVESIEARIAEMKEALKTAKGDEARKLRINLQTEQNKLKRARDMLNGLTSGREFSYMLRRAQESISYLMGMKSQEDVNKAADRMRDKAEEMRRTATEAAGMLEKIADREEIAVQRRYFNNDALRGAAAELGEYFGIKDTSRIEDGLVEIGLKMIAKDPGFAESLDRMSSRILEDMYGTAALMEGSNNKAVYGSQLSDITVQVLKATQKYVPGMKSANITSADRTEVQGLLDYVKQIGSMTRQAAKGMQRVAGMAQELKQETENTKAATAEIRRKLATAIRYYDNLNKQSDALASAERMERTIRQIESKAAKQVLEAQLKFQHTIENDRNVRRLANENLRERNKINTAYTRMAKLILNESDLKNVPAHMQGVARAAIRMVLMNDVNDMNRKLTGVARDTLVRSRQTMEMIDARDGTDLNLDNVKDFLGDDDVAVAIEEALNEMNEGIHFWNSGNGRTAAALEGDKAALERISKGLGQIYDIITRSQMVFLSGKEMALSDASNEVYQEAMKKDIYKEFTGGLGKVIKGIHRTAWLSNMTPEYFVKNLKNNGVQLLFNEFKEGEDKYGRIMLEAKEKVAALAEKTGFGSWDMQEKRTFELASGAKITMTLGEAMSVVATATRERTLSPELSQHLKKGGIVIESKEEKKAFGREPQRQKPIRLGDADTASIAAALTPQQQAYVDGMVQILSKDMGRYGNEASMRMNGIEKYKESYYFPYQVWSGVLNKASNAGSTVNPTNNNRAAHQRFTNRRVNNAQNALLIRDFTTVCAEHINQMATYATFGAAIENMNRVLNFRVMETEGDSINDAVERNIEAVLTERYGQNAMDYIRQFMLDLNGGAVQKNAGLGQSLMSMFKKNAVGGSLSVALQQPLSYIRASTMIDTKYLARALDPRFYRGSYDEMIRHSGVAVIKDMGKFDMNFARGAVEWLAPETLETSKARRVYNAVEDATNALPEKMDQMTWTRMWSAVKIEQHEQHPEMDMSSDEFLDMCGKRFNDVMRKTQVYDSVLVKSELMRNTGWVAKTITAFRAEPTVTLNMFMDAWMNRKEAGGKKNAAAVMATFLLGAIAQAAVKGIMGAGRNPDEKKTLAENFAYRFGSAFMSEANPLGLIPGMDNIITALSGNDINDNAWGMIKTFSKSLQTVFNPPTGEKLNATSAYRYIEDTVGQITQMMSGVPAKNLMRDSRAVYNWFTGDYANRARTDKEGNVIPGRASNRNVLKYQLYDQAANESLAKMLNAVAGITIWDSKTSAYEQRIYEAERDGNPETAAAYREYLTLGKGVSEKNISSAVASAAKADESISTAQRAEFLLDNGYADRTNWITEQYKKGELTEEETRELYRKYFPDKDPNSTFWNQEKQKWEDGEISDAQAKTAYMKYNPKKTEQDWNDYLWSSEWKKYKEGKISEAEAQRLYKQYHPNKEAKDMAATFWRVIEEEYKTGEISRAEAEKKYKMYYPEATADDIYLKFDPIDYTKETGREASGAYYRLHDAIEQNSSSAISKAVETLTKHGKKKNGFKSSIEGKWQETYQAMPNGSSQKVKLRDGITKAMRAAGFSDKEIEKMFTKWTKAAEKEKKK